MNISLIKESVRFQLVCIVFLCLVSVPAKARHIKLESSQLSNHVAIPYELRLYVGNTDMSDVAKAQTLERFAKSQADHICRAHNCGDVSCTHAVEYQYVTREVHQDVSLRIKDNSKYGSSVISRPWIASIDNETIKEEYFIFLRCSDQVPAASDEVNGLVHLQHALRSTGQLCSAEPSEEGCEKGKKGGGWTSFFQQLEDLKKRAPTIKSGVRFGADAFCLGSAIIARGVLDHCSTPNPKDDAMINICKIAFRQSGFPALIGAKLDGLVSHYRGTLTPMFLLGDEGRERLELKKTLESLQNKFNGLVADKKMLLENQEYATIYLNEIRKKLR